MDARWSGIDPRLYFVTDTPLCRRAGRTVAQTAALAVAGGAGIVQVRDKTLGDADFLALTRQVLAAVASATRGTGRRVPVVVNDRVAVARACWMTARTCTSMSGRAICPWPRCGACWGRAP